MVEELDMMLEQAVSPTIDYLDPGDQDLDGAEEEEGEGEGEVAREEGEEGEPPEFSLEFEGDEEEEGEGEEEGEEGEGEEEEEEEVGMEPRTRKEWPEGRSNVVEAFFLGAWDRGQVGDTGDICK